MDANQAIYDRDATSYLRGGYELALPEQRVVSLLGDRWPEIDMLDIGIGCGRTTRAIAPMARRYVGIDYSPRMIELARQRLDARGKVVELAVGDARDLSAFHGQFDFVLFSFNGLDSVDHADRLRVLREVWSVLKPAGSFLFSTHSMNMLPLSFKGSEASLRFEEANSGFDLEEARTRGWALIRDGAHNFELQLYYVDPTYQLKQLRETGFEKIAVYDMSGREISAAEAGREPYLHYHCHRNSIS